MLLSFFATVIHYCDDELNLASSITGYATIRKTVNNQPPKASFHEETQAITGYNFTIRGYSWHGK